MAANPYTKSERKKSDEGVSEQIADAATTVSAAQGGWWAFNAMAENTANPIKWLFGKTDVGAGLLTPNAITQVAGVVAAVPSIIEAGQELFKGNIGGAAQKSVKAVCCAAVAMVPATAIIDLGSRMLTGDGLVDHMENIAENVQSMFSGDNKNQVSKIDGSFIGKTSLLAGGLAAGGIAANHYIGKNGDEYTLGGLPTGANGKITSTTPQAIKGVNQVASVDYPRQIALEQNNTAQLEQEEPIILYPAGGKSATYWTNKSLTERGRQPITEDQQIENYKRLMQSGVIASGKNHANEEKQRDAQREIEAAQGAKI
jgi:hypothetical protein